MGDSAVGIRRLAVLRGAARWMLPAAGAAAAVLLSAGAAHATVDSIQYTGPASPTTADTLSWTVAGTVTDNGTGPVPDTLDCTLLLDGTPTGSGVDCTAGTFSSAAPTAGTYVLEVTDTTDGSPAVDSAPVAVVNPPLPAPGQPTPSAPPSPDSDTTPTWTLGLQAGSADATCTVTDSANTTVAGPATCSGTTWTSDLSAGASTGDYTLTVVANGDGVTAAGHSTPGTAVYSLDVTPPGALTVTAPASTGNDTTPDFTIAEAAPAAASYTCTLTLPDSSTVTLTTGCGVGTLTPTLGGGDGLYTLTVVADDGLGNTTTASAGYTLDTAAPTTPTVSRLKPAGNTSTPSFTVSNVDAGATVSCSVSGAATVTACSATGVSISITGGEGDYVVSVTATDAAHNQATGTFTYTYDITPPTQPTVSRTPALDNTRSPSFVVGSVDADATVTCAVSGAATVTGCSAAGVSISITGSDGAYVVSVTATDPAGNTATGTFTYTLDTTPPTTPVISRAKSLDHDTTPSFGVSEPDSNATVTCAVSAGATVTACSATGVSISITGPDGDYVVTVTAADPLGNSVSATYTYTLDTTPPTTPTVSRSKAVGNTSTPSFTVSTVDASSTVSCSVSAGATVTACSRTGVTISISGSDGDYVVSVTATDPAGNTSTGTFTYTYDITPPPAPDVTPPPALTNSTSVTLTTSDSEPDATVTCVLTAPGGGTVLSGACPGTFDTSGHGDGTYTLVVTATDPAGNTATTTVTWVRDTTPPPAPTVSAHPALTNSMSVQLTISDAEPTATLTCVLTGPGGGTVFSGGCPANGTFDTTGHGDGLYTLVVTATDAAGNTSSTTVTWTRDTVPPAQPTVTAPISPSSSRSPSFTVTDPDVVTTWQCTVSGPSTVTVSACGPTTTLNLTGAADGTYTLSVVAVDAAGNASPAGSATYTLDTTPPPAPSVSAPPALTKSMTVALTTSDSEPGAIVTCVLTAPGGATVLSGACPGTFDTTGFGDGTYTLVVTATDAAGNSSSTTVSWVRDTLPPPTPGVSAPSSPSKVTSPVFTVTDTENGVTYTCTVTGPSSVTASCGAATTINLAGATDGTYTLSVTATDAAGNVSPAGTATYLLDTTPPITPTVSATTSPSQGRHASFSVTGIEPGGVLTCTLTGPAGSTVTVPHTCSALVPLDLTGQPDGVYTLSVTVTDPAGNVSVAGVASYVLDTTAPAPPSVTAPATPGNDSTPTLAISAEPGASLTCTVDRYFQQVWTGACAPDGTVDLTGYDDGEFEITVTATDAAGNVSSETTVVYVLDTVAPAAPVLTEPASPSPIEKPVWLFTAEDGTIATCTITGPTGQVVQGPQTCTSPFTGLFKGLPDGKYTLTVVVTDAAGNVSVAARSVFILDRQAPVPPTVTPPRSPDSSRSPSWKITTPRGATLTCTLLRGGTVIDGPGACPADGTYSLAGMPDGTYTLKVTATDGAGNVSATSVSTYVLDTVRPATPQLDYSAPSPSLSVKPYWGFTLPAGTTGRCELLRNGVVLASKTDCKGAVSFDLTGRPVGTYTVQIVAVDSAGNVSHALTASYVLGISSPIGPPSTGGTGGTDGGVGPVTTPQHHRPASNPVPSQSEIQQVLKRASALAGDVGAAGKKVVSTAKHVASAILPDFHDKVTEHVSKAVQGVVNAVTHAGGGTGFPLLLLLIVLGFLIVQNRIDRRDPKLALASVAADDTIEFRPPPSRGSR